jgi:hypothetical protein
MPLCSNLFCCLAIVLSTIFVSPPIAFSIRLIVITFFGHPFLELNHKATNYLLQFSVSWFGSFGMNAVLFLQEKKALFFIISIA